MDWGGYETKDEGVDHRNREPCGKDVARLSV